MQNTIKILVDLKKEIYRFDQAQQGDDVILDLTILENGVAKDLTGETVELIYINGNNTIASVTGDKVVVSGNNVKITCPRDCTRSYGIAKFQLKIVSTYQVSTFPIALTIVPSVDQNQQISQNISTILEDLTAKNIECGETLDSLKSWISTGNLLNADLEGNIGTGTLLNTDLEDNITTVTQLKTVLTNVIDTGNALDTSLEEKIGVGNTLDATLKADTEIANTAATNLENVIETADTITYATQGQVTEINSQLADIPNQAYITEKANQSDLNETNSNVNATNIRIDNLVVPISPENTNIEVTDAHNSIAKNKNFVSIKARFEEIEKDNYIPITNIATNGNFSSSTANWISTTIAGLTTANNESTFTATAQNGALRHSTPTVLGKKYYAILQVKANSNLVRLEAGSVVKNHSGDGNYETLSITFDGTGSTLYVGAKDTRGAGWDSIAIKYLSIINLTDTFGVGYEPTVAQMDSLMARVLNQYIDGTMPIADKKWIVNNIALKAEKTYVDTELSKKLDKSSVTFKRAWVILGTLDIDTTALTVTWNGTNAYYGHDTGLSIVTNKGVALLYPSNTSQAFIYLVGNNLTVGTTNVTDGYLIGVLYNKKLYGSLNNNFITIDGVTIGKEWQEEINNLSHDFEIVMPDNLYLANGINLWTYPENVLKNGYALPEYFYLKSSRTIDETIPTGDYKRLIVKGNGSTSVATLSVVDSEDGTDITVKSKTVTVNSKAKPTGKTINTLVIGDSFIQYKYGDGILKYMKDFAIADGNTINFKGTIQEGDTGLLCEGRGGWNENDYHTLYVPTAQRDVNAPFENKKVSSPFVFSTNDTVQNSYFSFAKYMTDNGITGIDNIVFFLGMNYGNGTGIRDMITKIKADLPNVKIFVSLVPTSPYSFTTYQKGTRHNQNINYKNFFDNRQGESIYLMPTHCNVHNKAGIRNSTRNVFQFSDVDSTVEVYNTDVHPTPLGAKSIAYVIYNYLAYFN